MCSPPVEDDQVHGDEEQIVVPAHGFFVSEAGMPLGNLFVNGSEQDENEAERSKLR